MASKSTYELEVRLGAAASPSWKRTLGQVEAGLQGVNSLSNKIMTGIAAGVTVAAATATYAISDAVNTYTEFEQEMATVQSISGATSTEFAQMKKAAMEAGSSTVFTATESASALEYMSLAGWDVNTSIAGLMPILKTAAATGKELQTTSDLVTDSMSALGIGVDELDMYLDKLVASNNNANTTAEQLMEALVKTGGASRSLGADLDDTITALQILANNGLKGTEAGTALNAIFVRLAGNTTAIKELNKLGVDLWDDKGKFVGFKEGLDQISDAMDRLATDEQRTLSLKNIAGTHYYSQMSYLLNALDEEDGDSVWDALETKLANSTGALDNMYSITTDTLENAQKRLESAKQDMQIQLVDVFSDDAKEFVSWLADSLPNVTESLVEFAEAHKGEFAKALEGIGEGIESLWENGIEAGKWIIKHKGAVVGALTGMAAGMGMIKAAVTGISIAKFFTNPVTAAITAAGLAITAIAGIAGAIRDAEAEAVSANLASHFGQIALSMEDVEQVAARIVGSQSLTGALNALEEFEELDSIADAMQYTSKTIDKLNWKISIGMELTEPEKESYHAAINKFVSDAQDYALQAQYAVSLNMEYAFNDDFILADALTERINSFYAEKSSEIASLGKELNDAMTEAFNDGLLEIEEIETISNIQKQMADIEKSLAVGEYEAHLSMLETEYSGRELTPDSLEKLMKELDEQNAKAMEAYQESYIKNYSAVSAVHESGELSDGQYNSAVQELQEKLANEKAETQMRSLEFLVNTIYQTYGNEIGQYEKAVEDAIAYYSDAQYNSDWADRPVVMWDGLMNKITSDGADKTSKAAVGELLKTMEGSITGLYQLRDDDSLNLETQVSVQQLLGQIETLQGMATTNKQYRKSEQLEGLYRDVTNEVYGSDDTNIRGYVEQYYEDLTGYAKAATAAGIENTIEASKTETIQPVIEGMYAYSQEYLDQTFSQGLSASASLDLNIKPSFGMAGGYTNWYADNHILHNAQGGIYDHPILTTFAEEGPEAAVPLDGSARARNLWMQAGRILGMVPEGTRDQAILNGMNGVGNKGTVEKKIQITFSPNITIQGNAARDEVHSALTITINELREMLTEINRENERVSFG